MRRLILLITILGILIIGGCSQGKDFTIKSREFTDEQNEMLALTGNRAFKFELKNLPKDDTYDLKIVYEIYKNNEKILEKDIIGMAYGPTIEKIEDRNISIDIEENKIRVLSDGVYSYLDVEEDLSKLINYYFNGDRKINIGDEVYLFHANDNGHCAPMNKLGLLSSEEIGSLIADNKLNVFIKLVCKQIKEWV